MRAVKRTGKAVLIHSCGQVQELFPELIEAGLDVFNPFQPEVMDPYEIKREFGSRLAFLGGVSVQKLLPFGTPQQIRDEVRRLMDGVGADGGFIIAPSHDMPGDIPLENLAGLRGSRARRMRGPLVLVEDLLTTLMNKTIVHTLAAFTLALLLGPLVRSGAAQVEHAKAFAPYLGWKRLGSLYILTTPEGANLPATASEEGFPLLVRLNRDFFNFSQAKANGEDIRFATSTGTPLAYQIDEWDAAAGKASIWVRIPTIKGNARQEIKMYWGKADAASESSGSAVFNESNGYLSVWHMNDPVKDEVGTLESKDTGTTSSSGMIGKSRHFDVGKGINCGENITTYPSGSSPHSSEAWFRAEKPNATVMGWGNEQAQGKVVMQFASPPHINMDCYFSGGNVASGSTLPMSQWIHVVHTYKKGDSRIYVNGLLDGVRTTEGAPLAIKSPARMYIGGWYNNYEFVGDIDEVRISKVARSADWVRMEYENQKPLQTLAGPLVQPGADFSVSEKKITLMEGKSATVTARAGGAQKVYWILKADGKETIAAVDRFRFTFDAGRVAGDRVAHPAVQGGLCRCSQDHRHPRHDPGRHSRIRCSP